MSEIVISSLRVTQAPCVEPACVSSAPETGSAEDRKRAK